LMCATLIVAAATAAGQNAAQDYPQWRGKSGDGSASAFIGPSTWPDALTRRWSIEVGEGYATPLVIGDTVYVFARRDGDEVLLALDASSGAERWRSAYPLAYTPSGPTVAHGSGPKATPLFHEGKLFTLGISGILSAFDARTGTRLWQTAAPAEVPFYSAASSPVGAKGVVIAHPGNYEPLTAFDVNTGVVKWRAGAGGFFMSPLIVTLGGVAQVVSVTQEDVIGVSLDSGAVLWKQTWAGGGMGGTMPIAYEDTIIAAFARSVFRGRCEDGEGAVARPAAAGHQRRRRESGRTVVPAQRHRRTDCGASKPGRVRAVEKLHRRRERDVGAADALRHTHLRQRREQADALDY
jgi:hypothetical protein